MNYIHLNLSKYIIVPIENSKINTVNLLASFNLYWLLLNNLLALSWFYYATSANLSALKIVSYYY